MARWAILSNTGFRYDLVTEVEAPTAFKAREWFKREYAGDFRAEDFKVSRR